MFLRDPSYIVPPQQTLPILSFSFFLYITQKQCQYYNSVKRSRDSLNRRSFAEIAYAAWYEACGEWYISVPRGGVSLLASVSPLMKIRASLNPSGFGTGIAK
jgi:hypothetical protein